MTTDLPLAARPGFPFVVLAAGAGSRFGGEKPLAAVGPGGESLLDYTIFDAVRSGFDPVVVVVSPRNRAAVEAHLRLRHDPARLRWIVQGAGHVLDRTRPWGTVDAVVAARQFLPGQFAVANADDFYGLDAVLALTEAMAHDDIDHLVTYPWRCTMPPNGSANRALCTVDSRGRLVSIEERRGLTEASALDPDEQVSMNLWAFGSATLPLMAASLASFMDLHRGDADAELAI